MIFLSKILPTVPTKDKIYLLSIIGLVIFVITRESCSSASTNKLISDIANYKTEAKVYKDKFDNNIAYNNTLALDNAKQLKELFATNDTMKQWIKKFKDIKVAGGIKETTIIREVQVPFDRPIPCDFKPFPAKKEDKWFNIYSTISNTGLTIDSLKIPNEMKYVSGSKKLGFLGLKGKEWRMEVMNTNPYIHVSNISAYTITDKPKWYETRLFAFGVGFAGGFATNSFLLNKK